MLERTFTKRFRKELKLMGKRGMNLGKLREAMDLIIDEQPLPRKYEDHPLHGNHRGKRECHIQGDWVLVYRVDDLNRKVVFHYTGSHSDLF